MIVDLSLDKYANMTEEQATHAAAQEITTLTIERSGLKKEVRSYEVSLWTLLDDFITVLKWSDAELRGRILDPLMKLDVDGTLNFTFSIPMYIYVELLDSLNLHVERLLKLENPIWYNTLNDNLIASMRKIKVIINKGKSKERVIEFLITKVSESHEQDLMMCNIECEGLAFHELGKIGYKISLNLATFRVDENDWYNLGHWTKYDGTISTIKPVENVLYWCEKCGLISYPGDNVLLNPKQWYYDILMNWDSFKTAGNSHIVYENEFVSSWTDELTPNTIISGKEKWRIIDVNESNIYNITQTIAETFKIYCRYEYKYDDNYHIIGRKIIFYNNYLNEDNMLSFTYPYDLANVTREMDATDLVTKMYVRPLDNSAVVSGLVSIANCSASKTKEDYLLNFDYLYMIGAITKELYDEIPVFEKAVRALNKELEALELQINAYLKKSIEQSALAEVYNNSKTIDGERIDHNNALYRNLDKSDGDQDGYFTRGPAHPYSTYIKTDKATGRRYIKLSDEDKGIDPNYLMIFRSYNTAKLTFKNRITNYSVEYDAYGFASEITLSGFSDNFTLDTQNTEVNVSNWSTSQDGASDTASSSSSLLVYLVYKYKPVLYYEKINLTWLKKLNLDTEAYDTAKAAETEAKNNLDSALESLKLKLAEKRILVDRFSRMMGPALREGYWQPEDYTDYGNTFNFNDLSLSTYDALALLSDTGNNTAIGWDATLFDSEDKLYFEETVLRNLIYYPCIALNSTMLSRIATWIAAGKKPQLIFNNNYYKDLTNDERLQAQNLEMFTLGGALKLGFMHGSSSATIVPILIVTGAEDMTDDLINFMINNSLPKLGIVDININETTNEASLSIENDAVSLSTGNFYWYDNKASGVLKIEGYEILYPRIKISSNDLNTNSIVLKYNNNLLQNYTDYEVLSRTTIRNNEGNEEAYFEYFITIKPVTLLSTGGYTSNFDITYVLSNAATSIYLDAQDVMIDSSKPRVSYTVKVNALNTLYLNAEYDDLARIVMINDSDLKFENVFGYISGLKLNLDKPWEDEIEVKNYKTKFEDLFSMIVASSEAMKRSGAAFNAAANGEIPLTEETLVSVIENNESILLAYLDSGFDSSLVVINKLTELFDEAGKILGCANKSLESIYNLNLKNASILAGFIENVTADLTPKVVTSQALPTSYKVGDIWDEVDENGIIIARHVATSSSTDSALGYTKTFDGTLSSIKGANMEYDAVEGTVDIYGEHNIQLRSGLHVYIGAGDSVDIVGNRAVNIGGATVNIAAGNSENLNGGYTTGGINLVSSYVNFDLSDSEIETAIANAINNSDGTISKVLIHPKKIELGSSEILMKSSSKMDFIVSTGTEGTTSAIRLDAELGVWIGSGAGLRLFSGSAELTVYVGPNHRGTFRKNDYWIKTTSVSGHPTYDTDESSFYSGFILNPPPSGLSFEISGIYKASGDWDEYYNLESAANSSTYSTLGWESYSSSSIGNALSIIRGAGASVELNNNHLLLGYSSYNLGGGAATMEFTADAIVLGVGNTNGSYYEVNGLYNGSGGLIGAKLTKESIGFATSYLNSLSAVIMNKLGVTIGHGANVDLANSTKEQLRASNGSYVRVAAEGIEMGSLADLYINTDNFKLQTHNRDKNVNDNDFRDGETIMAVGSNLQNVDENSAYNPASDAILRKNDNGSFTAYSSSPVVNFLVNRKGAYVKGSVYANAFVATGIGNNKFIANSTKLGFYNGTNEVMTLSGSELLCSGTFRIAAENLYLGTGSNTLSSTLTTMNSEKIVESVKVYRISNSSSDAPAISNDGLTTADSNWGLTVPSVTSSNQYLWSAIRTKDGAGKYYYTTPRYEGVLSDLFASTYTEYTRVASNVTITDADMGNYTWTVSIPAYTTSTTAASGANYAVTTMSNSAVWCRKVTVKASGITYSNPEKDNTLSDLSLAAILAVNIASGNISVPHVSTTGIEITKDSNGNGIMNITSTGTLTIAGNHSISLYSSSANNALELNANGITIASGLSIGIAGGSIAIATVDANHNTVNNGILLNSSGVSISSGGNLTVNTNNFVINSNASSSEDMFRLGTSGSEKLLYKNGTLYITGNNLNISTTNLIINSNAIGTLNDIFRLGTSEAPLLEYKGEELSITGNVKIGGETLANTISASLATLGGWTIDATLIHSDIGSSSTYVALDSGTEDEDCAIWAGASDSEDSSFRVKRNGKVYLNALMVLDKKEDNKWGLGGTDNDHEGIYWDNNDNHYYGYKAIDFSKLNFKLAVSVTGSWSSDATFTARVSLWGVLNKSTNLTASFSVNSVTLGSWQTGNMYRGTASVGCTINNTTGQDTSVRAATWIDCGAAIERGWMRAANCSLSHTKGSSATVYGLPSTDTFERFTRTYDISDVYTNGYDDGKKDWRPGSISQNTTSHNVTVLNDAGDSVGGPYSASDIYSQGVSDGEAKFESHSNITPIGTAISGTAIGSTSISLSDIGTKKLYELVTSDGLTSYHEVGNYHWYYSNSNGTTYYTAGSAYSGYTAGTEVTGLYTKKT